jgi:hypothetical protein
MNITNADERMNKNITEMSKIHNPILETACNLIIELEDYANAEQKERIDELFYQIEIINELDFQMNLQNENNDETH